MQSLFKAIFWVSVVLIIIILPAYLWSIWDRESYEDFLLKGVSPLSQNSRNSILEKRVLGSKNSKIIENK